MISLERGSLKLGAALPRGCVHCREGAKMVLLVTGLCGERCFYCPISGKKRHRDVLYANELFVGEFRRGQMLSEEQLLSVASEAESIDAEGTGITGGDPFQVPERTIQLIGMLKRKFGEGHHIHLYTGCSGTDPEETVRKLVRAGLDEIRFHFTRERLEGQSGVDSLDRVLNCLETAREAGMVAGVEIPILPGGEKEIYGLLPALAAAGARFLNLNELEFSETNCDKLLACGYDVRDDVSSAAAGSRESAERLLEMLDREVNPKLPDYFTIHFCSSSYKDAVQLRKRIIRRARHVATETAEVTDEGLLVKGVLEFVDPESIPEGGVVPMLDRILGYLIEEYDIPSRYIAIDAEKSRIEIAPFVLEELVPVLRETGIKERIGTEPAEFTLEDLIFSIIEEYPTADRLEVERRGL